MGAGMILLMESRRARGWSYWQIARHFLIRGILLIALEQFLLDPVLYERIIWTEYGVLFGLGGAMLLGILFLRLNTIPLAIIGSGLILISPVLPRAMIDLEIYYPPLVRLFLVPGQSGDWFTIYPIFPWLGITLLGMAFARELKRNHDRAIRGAMITGMIFLALFGLIRAVGGYGNFQPPAGSGWIDFLNMIKYPPSLAFTLSTLGTLLLFIVLFDRIEKRWNKRWLPLIVFGQTALYFYFMHWFLLDNLSPIFPEGSNLLVMYICWAILILLLYPLCRGYRKFKQSTAPESIWRFF
jgi:uncharacterized membrane protein